jgi:low temperature requirement protein LtrA
LPPKQVKVLVASVMLGGGPYSPARHRPAPARVRWKTQPIAEVPPTRHLRLNPVMRQDARVTPLELFFDLVFVLALTQCTALMAAESSWRGLVEGLLVLAVLWWSWCGYAWLTSVVDPEEGAVRLVIFAAMAGFLVASLCVPRAFGRDGLLFASAYAFVRAAHLLLYLLASRDDPGLRRSVVGLGLSTGIGVGLLIAASFTGIDLRLGLWAVAVAFDMGGPFVFGVAGWRLVPGHFAERHGLIVLIAIGESVVAIGVGGRARLDGGVILAAVLGTAVAAAFWWLYFDVVALAAERRLSRAAVGREQNSIARDSYSYIHFPMIAGIALTAVGMKQTLVDVEAHLKLIPAVAMLGGAAIYLFAHVAFRMRNMGTFNKQRLVIGILLVSLIPVGVSLSSLATLGLLAAVLIGLIAYEAVRFADARRRIRHQLVESG